jgi:hypothetical protein
MSHRSILLCSALTMIAASSAHAGPPWIAVELPANPHHATTRGASMLIRAYHHSTALDVPVTGTAEGIVDGRRVSYALDIARTNQPGVFAVRTPLPKGGVWVLAVTLEQSADATATALVTVGPGGRIAGVEVPSSRSRDGWSVPRRVEPRDIDAALRAAQVAFGESSQHGRAGYAYALPLLLLGAAAAVTRRRQTSV